MKSKNRFFILVVTLIMAAFMVVSVGADGPDPSAAETTANEAAGAPVASTPSTWSPSGPALYDNGPLVNCVGCGVGGADESVLQSTSLGMSILGFGHQLTAGNRMADDFTVPAGGGWDVDGFVFYAYQSFAGSTSTITAVNYRIWDGEPGNGGTVIYGDNSTNQMVSTGWSNILRVSETTTGGNTDRHIMASEAGAVLTEGGGLHLPPGTYWVDWQADGSASFSGPWAPPVTINGQCVTGNALQSQTDNGVTWTPVLDTASGCAQDMPFLILGSEAGGSPSPEGKTYEVTVTGGPPPTAPAGSPVCLTFGAPDTIGDLQMSGVGQGFWTELTLTPDRALSQGKIKDGLGYAAQLRVVTKANGQLRGKMKDNMGGVFSLNGFENPTCGTP